MSDRGRSLLPDAQIGRIINEPWLRTDATTGKADSGLPPRPSLAVHGPGLAPLPHKTRRGLRSRWRRSFTCLALAVTLGQVTTGRAAQINVGIGTCSLVDAITAANADASTGGCPAGSGPDTLILPQASTQTLTAIDNATFGPTGLPVIRSTIVIDGNGSTIARDPSAPAFRILAVGLTGELTLRETTVTGGRISESTPNRKGGGIANYGSLALADSTIAGNSATRDGGGVHNAGSLTVTQSTISGNSAGDDGGLRNDGAATLVNSTVSGNSAIDRAGGIRNSGTLRLFASTVSANSAQGTGGGIFNKGTLIVTRSIVSGNLAARSAPEVRNRPFGGTVVTDGLNVFGYEGSAGISGFEPGASDLVPSVPLTAVLDPRLADQAGPTRTHALVFGSPAIDAIPAASCGTANDQRAIARPQDGDRNGVADCDIGAFELRLPPQGVVPPPPLPPVGEARPVNRSPRGRCRRSSCRVQITCEVLQGPGAPCNSPVTVFVGAGALRVDAATGARSPRRIRFATGVATILPGQTLSVRLRLTRRGREIVRTSTRRSIRGALEIQNVGSTFRNSIRLRLPR